VLVVNSQPVSGEVSDSSVGEEPKSINVLSLLEANSDTRSNVRSVLLSHASSGLRGEVKIGSSKSDKSPALVVVELDPFPNLSFSLSSESEVVASIDRGSASGSVLLLNAVDVLFVSDKLEPESEVGVEVEVLGIEVLGGHSLFPPESPSLLSVGVVAGKSRPVGSEVPLIVLGVGVPEVSFVRIIGNFRNFSLLAGLERPKLSAGVVIFSPEV
jgi:hypothetical protein